MYVEVEINESLSISYFVVTVFSMCRCNSLMLKVVINLNSKNTGVSTKRHMLEEVKEYRTSTGVRGRA